MMSGLSIMVVAFFTFLLRAILYCYNFVTNYFILLSYALFYFLLTILFPNSNCHYTHIKISKSLIILV